MARDIVPRNRSKTSTDQDPGAQQELPLPAAAASAPPAPVRSPTHDVALFATCLVDLFRPSVGLAAAKLLETGGAHVALPRGQTCCGQPAYNSGDRAAARGIAKRTIKTLEPYRHVVAPSGSCAGMVKKHYPELFEDDPRWLAKAKALAAKTHELTAFLADVLKVKSVDARYDGVAAYHDSCSCLREMGVRGQPRALLGSVDGLAVRDLPSAETCCGLGGTFSVKYPEVSGRMGRDKAGEAMATGADTLIAADLGCLLHLSGLLHRDGAAMKVYHVAEILAGAEAPPLGGTQPSQSSTQTPTQTPTQAPAQKPSGTAGEPG